MLTYLRSLHLMNSSVNCIKTSAVANSSPSRSKYYRHDIRCRINCSFPVKIAETTDEIHSIDLFTVVYPQHSAFWRAISCTRKGRDVKVTELKLDHVMLQYSQNPCVVVVAVWIWRKVVIWRKWIPVKVYLSANWIILFPNILFTLYEDL